MFDAGLGGRFRSELADDIDYCLAFIFHFAGHEAKFMVAVEHESSDLISINMALVAEAFEPEISLQNLVCTLVVSIEDEAISVFEFARDRPAAKDKERVGTDRCH